MPAKDTIPKETALFPRYPGWCSFCRKIHKEVGPLAEGPDLVFICYQCCLLCASMIQTECRRRGIDMPEGKEEVQEKRKGDREY